MVEERFKSILLLTDQTVLDTFTFGAIAYLLGRLLSTRFTFLKPAKEARAGDKNAKDTIQKERPHMVTVTHTHTHTPNNCLCQQPW